MSDWPPGHRSRRQNDRVLARPLPLLGGALALALAAGCAAPHDDRPFRGGPVRSSWDRLRQVNARIGSLDLDEERWGRLDSPIVLGVDYVESVGWNWLALEGGLEWAYDEANTTIPATDERVEESLGFVGFSAGVLASPPPDSWRLRPYVGAGASILWTDVDRVVGEELFDDDDSAIGGYMKAGLLFQVTYETHVGIEVRMLDTGGISAGDEEISLDGMTVALVFGATFDWFAYW